MNLFNKPNNEEARIKDIVRRSTKATCGAFEREVVVPADRVQIEMARLDKAGFFIKFIQSNAISSL